MTGEIHSHNNPIADLVMAMLAVNGWRLEQSGAIFKELLTAGVFDPSKILSWTHGELHTELKIAGYNKSDFVIDLVCDRLFDMARKLSEGGSDTLQLLCAQGNKDALRELLLSIKGVGPKVFENFCLLQGIK